MNDCLNCANHRRDGKCRTMFAPVKGYRCHMTREQAIEAENEISEYSRQSNITAAANLNIRRLNAM